MSLSGFAVDLGGTKIAAARIEDGRVAVKVQDMTDPAAGLDAQIDKMAHLLRGIGHSDGQPVGVAVAGRVDHQGNWHAVNTKTLSAITAAPLGALLVERFGYKSCAINDAAAAAVAEAKLGAGQGAYNFAYITVSSPYGSARCGSGRVGTVESIAGGKALAAAAGLADAKAVFESGEHEGVIALAAASVGTLITDLTSILGLDRVAIGGSIGLARGFLDRVKSQVASEPELFRTEICAAALGHDSGLLGALMHCQDKS